MNRRTLMALGASCATLGSWGCRGPVVKDAPAKIEITQVVDGGLFASFGQLVDGGLAFGSVPVLTPVQQTLTVTNLGTGDLQISDISFSPDGGPFSIAGTLPTDIGGGSNNSIVVQFEATQQQSYAATLEITSTDDANPTIKIPLTGTGSTEGLLEIDPNPLDFGSVGQGQTLTKSVTLKSVGTAPLRITAPLDFGTVDPAITLGSSTNLGDAGFIVLDIGDSIPLYFTFAPTATTPATATATYLIGSSDPTQQPAVLELKGETILAPVAVIFAPQTVAQGDTVILDGGGSYDPNLPALIPLTYSWALADSPPEHTSIIPDTASETATLTLDAVGDYKFRLQVTNTSGVPSAYAYATVHARPTDDLYVEMIWGQSPVDVDLHLLVDGGVIGGAGDCNAYNPDAGFNCAPGSDHLVGPGPEYIGVAIPPDGDYAVECELTDAKNISNPTQLVTVRVYVYGVLTTQVCQNLTFVGDVWPAVTIAWPSGVVTPIGPTVSCPATN